MAPRVAKHVSDMEIDEISLVDRPANQHALVTIAKRRAPEEDAVPDYIFYDAQGQEVDPDTLNFGDHVFDAEGQEYVLEEDTEDEPELEPAGVSKAFETPSVDSLGASILDELSKAVTESDKNEVIAKALAQNAELAKRLEQAEQIAKSERTLRLEREYISKAAEYNVPIPADELGPVLMRMAETMSYEDCSVIHKALTAAGEMLFEEAGYDGMATNAVDPMAQIENYVNQNVSKSADTVSKAQALTGFFEENPEAYDAYIQSMKQR